MPTILTHPAVPLALGLGLGARVIPRRLLAAGVLFSILPDSDVYLQMVTTAVGHRGVTHSLFFAFLCALFAALIARVLKAKPTTAFVFVFVAAASHGLLDMFTNGGGGISYFWPFNDARYFMPWRPIEVSPLGITRFFSARGAHVLGSELLWVWLPAIVFTAIAHEWRTTFRRTRTRRKRDSAMSGWLIAAVVLGAVVLAYLVLNARQGKPQRGEPAPEFELPDQNGTAHSLREFRGKWLVLYFYPRDDTPGCAEQAMRYRNAMRDLEELGASVCGVSMNSTDSHAAFARKYNLPFALLADRDGAVAGRYGSLRDFGFFRFAKRNTFLVDPDGKVEKVYLGVNATRNTQDVTEDLKKLAA